MIFLNAFIIGGLICAIGQLLIDCFKLLPVHITCLFVAIGSLLDTFGIYDKLIDFAGCGATIPISSFGHSLTHAAMEATKTEGFMGIFTNVFDMTGLGISVSIMAAFLVAICLKSKG